MSLLIGNHKLTQTQLDAIVPVINKSLTERMSKKRIEQECIDACEAAGCPIPANYKDANK